MYTRNTETTETSTASRGLNKYEAVTKKNVEMNTRPKAVNLLDGNFQTFLCSGTHPRFARLLRTLPKSAGHCQSSQTG